MKEKINDKLVEFHKKCSVDCYGQVGTLSLSEVFGSPMNDEVTEYVKTNKFLINIRTYGGKLGIWSGFTIEDSQIRANCNEALRANINYKLAMTTW